MKISIIVPYWNVEKYLEACIKSLISQTLKEIEILLIDDHSEDGSYEIAKRYCGVDARIKLIKHDVNLGLGGARNTGIKNAQGEFLWFVDSDDVITSDACEKMYQVATRDKSDIVIFNYRREFLDGYKDSEKKFVRGVKKGFEDSFSGSLAISGFTYSHLFHSFIVCNKLWRTRFLIDNDCFFLERTHFEDNIHLLWMLNARTISYLDECFYIYNVRKGSITTRKRRAEDYVHHLRMMKNFEEYSSHIDMSKFSNRVVVLVMSLQLGVFNKWMVRCYSNADHEMKQKIICEITEMLLEFFGNERPEVLNDAVSFFEYKSGWDMVLGALINKSKPDLEKSLTYVFENFNNLDLGRKISRYALPAVVYNYFFS